MDKQESEHGNSSSESAQNPRSQEDSPDDAPTAGSSTGNSTFESLGLIPPLLEALKHVGYTKPTEIQAGVIPHALEGKDVIGVAETVNTTPSFQFSKLTHMCGTRGPEKRLLSHCLCYKNFGTSHAHSLRVCLRRLGMCVDLPAFDPGGD